MGNMNCRQADVTHTIQAQRSRTPMWVYEKNFVLLHSLFPDPGIADHFEFIPDQSDMRFSIHVLERCRYTRMLELRQKLRLPESCIRELVMKIRIYYDARLAEVTGYKGMGRLQPSYCYPNKEMMLKDEKRQANILLHEWLSLVLAHDLKQNREYA